MVRAMRAAIADAGLTVGDVSAVSANGSSSVFYDPLEAMAIRELLGDEAAARTPVMSVKGALGQTGAATPALQAVAAVLSVERGLLPPTINADGLDPRCPIALVREPRPIELGALLANAIGFGGHYYASLIFTRPERDDRIGATG
jgi:3-oxoacyl-[acyl-carrier-protein] synthase II